MQHISRRLLFTLVGPLGVGLIAGCGAASTQPAQHARITSCVTVDDATGYESLQQLRRDSTSVALISPDPVTSTQFIGHIPSTITTVTVKGTLSGNPLPTKIKLRQTETENVQSDDGNCETVVSPQHAYIAYLQPFQFEKNGPQVDGEYVVTGDLQGLYQGPAASATGDMTSETATRRSFTPVSRASLLPRTLSIAEAAETT